MVFICEFDYFITYITNFFYILSYNQTDLCLRRIKKEQAWEENDDDNHDDNEVEEKEPKGKN